jgi:hypothetical protein
MPADLDQFGRDNSHGTVIGGKGLVQLGHHASNGGGPFHQVDIVAGIGQVQGSLHPGNATTYHHHCTGFVLFHFFPCLRSPEKVYASLQLSCMVISNSKSEARNPKQIQMTKAPNAKQRGKLKN